MNIKTLLIERFKSQIPPGYEKFISGKIVMNYRDKQILGLADVLQAGVKKTHNTNLPLDEQSKMYLEGLAGNTSDFSEVEIIEFRISPEALQVWVYGVLDGRKLGKKMLEL